MTAMCAIPTCAVPTPLTLQGIREFAKRAGAEQGAVTEEQVEAWLAGEKDAQLPPILRGRPSELKASRRHHGKQLEAPTDRAQAAGGAHAALAGGRRQLAAQPAGLQPGLVLGSGQDGVGGSGDRHGGSGGSAGGGGGSAGIQLAEGGSGKERDEPELSLFAFPAMDNYGGVRSAPGLVLAPIDVGGIQAALGMLCAPHNQHVPCTACALPSMWPALAATGLPEASPFTSTCLLLLLPFRSCTRCAGCARCRPSRPAASAGRCCWTQPPLCPPTLST